MLFHACQKVHYNLTKKTYDPIYVTQGDLGFDIETKYFRNFFIVAYSTLDIGKVRNKS